MSRSCGERCFDTMLQLLHPAAPHITEELWEMRGYSSSLLDSRWPEFDESHLVEETVTVVVQVDGKLRDRIEVATDAAKEAVEAAALASERVAPHLEGRTLVKTIVVPGRLVNLVTRS